MAKDKQFGVRYSIDDDQSKKRSMMVSVVSTKMDTSLLLEFESKRFSAIYIQGAMLAALAALGFVASF